MIANERCNRGGSHGQGSGRGTGPRAPASRAQRGGAGLHTLLLWQIPAFLLTGLLVLALPKVKPATTVPGGA